MESLFSFILSIRWQDIIDITINSYLLFRVYMILRGTTTVRSLMGLAALWLVKKAAESAGLLLTSWVIEAITALAALIVIVVFRNEIRRVFQVPRGYLFWGSPGPVNKPPESIIAKAVFDMARKKCGAILVFQGREDISSIIKNELIIDSKISKEILESVFWKLNPLHDGAAVISGSRIKAVKAVLPLTPRTDLPSDYGTRHRAGIGITEISDALSVIVSEETGKVTAISFNNISVMETEEQLEERIKKHFGPDHDTPEKTRERLKIAGAAFIAFVFVFTAWFAVTRGKNTLISMEAPIEFVNKNPDSDIAESSYDSATVQVTGSEILVNAIRDGQIRIQVDLSKAHPGLNRFELDDSSITLPAGIRLKKISPANIEVVIDTISTKRVPVQIDWGGKLPEGIRIVSALANPDTVVIKGRTKILEGIDTAYTTKIQVDSITGSGSITIPLMIESASLSLAPGEKDRIEVTYGVEKQEQKPEAIQNENKDSTKKDAQ